MSQNSGFTPMMQQYLDIKNQNGEAILFYRLGDFYEMFFDDAMTASKELDLTLTGRDCGQSERAPMCGVPYHSAEGYIARLIQKGYKVAICEQTEDPAAAKGLVKREVVRTITPGTVIEPSMLQEGENNFIAAIYLDSRGYGACFCDISTGQFLGTACKGANPEKILDELAKFSPKEVILSDGAFSNEAILSFAKDRLSCLAERGGEWRFEYENSLAAVKKQFGRDFADTLTPDDFLLVQAAGGLLSYLTETQKSDLGHIDTFEKYKDAQFMTLDYITKTNLEIAKSNSGGGKKGALLGVLDKTKTPMGARLIRQWLERPLLDPIEINERLFAVDFFVKNPLIKDELSDALSNIGDIERTISRIVYGSANARDLCALHRICPHLPAIRGLVQRPGAPKKLTSLALKVHDLADIYALIHAAIDTENPPFSVREGGMIKAGYSKDVDHFRSLLSGGRSTIAQIEQRERERTGIPKLKVGFNRVFGYYIEITKSYLSMAPSDYIRKQTLASAERFITPELKELESEILKAGESLNALEYEIFCQIKEQVALLSPIIMETSHAIASLDVLQSFANVAAKMGYTMPQVDDSDKIIIKEGRHPVVENAAQHSLFVPNDTTLDCNDNRVYVITGPNMAGKSTYMRQVALIVIMAQCGSFVPAAEAQIGVVDGIFTRIGANDDLFSGKSTFMVEMSEVAHILKNATQKSLIIFDEIGRGTSTFDGMSIARAVLEYTADKKRLGAKTLFATHYHELCDLEDSLSGVKNYNVVVKKRGDDIIFIKKVVRGGTNDSFGIEVAKLAGVPDVVVRRAKQVLQEVETRNPNALAPLAQRPEKAEKDQAAQLSLGSFAGNSIVEALSALEPDVLSPIEALSILYDLSKKAKEIN